MCPSALARSSTTHVRSGRAIGALVQVAEDHRHLAATVAAAEIPTTVKHTMTGTETGMEIQRILVPAVIQWIWALGAFKTGLVPQGQVRLAQAAHQVVHPAVRQVVIAV